MPKGNCFLFEESGSQCFFESSCTGMVFVRRTNRNCEMPQLSLRMPVPAGGDSHAESNPVSCSAVRGSGLGASGRGAGRRERGARRALHKDHGQGLLRGRCQASGQPHHHRHRLWPAEREGTGGVLGGSLHAPARQTQRHDFLRSVKPRAEGDVGDLQPERRRGLFGSADGG